MHSTSCIGERDKQRIPKSTFIKKCSSSIPVQPGAERLDSGVPTENTMEKRLNNSTPQKTVNSKTELGHSNGHDDASRGDARNSLMQGLTSPTRSLNQRGHEHASFIISLFEGRKYHAIFRKNNLNF